MNHILLIFHGITITGWKLVGYLGILVFASRWLVQLYSSKKAGRPVMTIWFWVISLTGSVLLVSYFFFGKNDSVGIFANIFPAFVSVYNLMLELKFRKRQQQDELEISSAPHTGYN